MTKAGYFRFTLVAWEQTLNYRLESLIWFALEFIPPLVMISFWHYLFSVGRYSLADYSNLVWYYLFTLLFSRISSLHFEEWVIDSIKDGDISSSLIKPYFYPWSLFFHEIAWRISGLIYLLPALLLLCPLYRVLMPFPASFVGIAVFLAMILIAYLQRFFLGLIISTTAFFTAQAKSFLHLRWMLEGIFGGAWLPVYFFPNWLQHLSQFTPFYYWYYFPVRALTGHLEFPELFAGLIISLVWIVILRILSFRYWAYAIKNYSAVGH